MLLTSILEKNAKERPDKTALTMRMGYRTVALSYREVYDLSLKTACFLQKQGVEKDDKVLLLAPNSPYWILVFFGCLFRGAVPVPLNIQSTGEMVTRVADQTDAKLIFKYLHYKEELPVSPTSQGGSQNLKSYDIEFLIEELEKIDCTGFEKEELKENDFVQILYTSGTTGDPKGVPLTHKNIFSNVESLSKIIPISPEDKFLSILPLSHILEQSAGFFVPFYNGSQIVFAESPSAIKGLLKEHKITKMVAVPEFLKVVMNRIEAGAEEKGKKEMLEKMMALSLKLKSNWGRRFIFFSIHKEFGGKLDTVASGGAPLEIGLEKKWEALGVSLLQGYGLTETSPIVSLNSYKEHKLGSIGKILPGVEVKIADDGEILVKGPGVFGGYFKNEEKTREAFTEGGWFRTDDMGELDDEGFLFIKGRKKYMILGPGGQNVFPEDIEFELNKASAVEDSCVVGIEKPGGQMEIHAVLLGEIKQDEVQNIIEEANKKLASYQRVINWSIWDEEDFPRSATRKVQKGKVMKWLEMRQEKVAPEPMEEKTPLQHLLAEITGTSVAEINGNTKIVSELGIDSLLRIELVSRIEEKFGAEIEEVKITLSTKVADLEEMIKKGNEVKKEKYEYKDWPRKRSVSFLRFLVGAVLVVPSSRIFMSLKIEGRENLKGLKTPAVFMPNHISYFDSLALLMAVPTRIRRQLSFAAAIDVLYTQYKKYAFWGELLFNTFPFPRKEYEKIKPGLNYVGRMLDKGWSVAVFPEGKMSTTGELLPLKRGAGLIAVEMDCQIVPVKISGTAEVLPPGKHFPKKRGAVTVKFGKPIKFKRSDSYIEATQKIEAALREL